MVLELVLLREHELKRDKRMETLHSAGLEAAGAGFGFRLDLAGLSSLALHIVQQIAATRRLAMIGTAFGYPKSVTNPHSRDLRGHGRTDAVFICAKSNRGSTRADARIRREGDERWRIFRLTMRDVIRRAYRDKGIRTQQRKARPRRPIVGNHRARSKPSRLAEGIGSSNSGPSKGWNDRATSD